MRRLLVALVMLAATAAYAAVDTVTVQGKVLTPSGAAATAGKITCDLSQAASAAADGYVQRVASRSVGTIGTDGTVTLALVPNDIMTPAGTYYTCRFSVTAPLSASWTEKWSISATPDPVDIGSISRLDVAPGITTGVYVVALSTCSGACPNGGVCIDKDDGAQYYCYASVWTRQDLPNCSPDPPTGACTAGSLCQSYDGGFSIYGCYSSAWAEVTGGGTSSSTVSVDGVSVSNPDLVDDGDIDFDTTAAAGHIIGTVKADAVELSTDTTGTYVASATTGGGLTVTGTEEATVGVTPCGSSQILKWDGDSWECASDETGAAGTVTYDGTTYVPAKYQIAWWTDSTEIGGDEDLTYDGTNRLTATNLTVTNAIVGSITGNAATATSATSATSATTAATATALAANGANCSAGQYPLGVSDAGVVESCTADDDNPDADAEVPDAITVSSSGSVAWTALTSYPAACSAGQFVSTIADTLTCGTPSLTSATQLDADADSIANVTADADSVDFSLDGTGTVARVASDGSYVQVGTTADGTRGATFQNNTSAGSPVEPAAPDSGYTLLYSFGTGAAGELYKKNNTDGTSERLILTSGNLVGDVTADATGNVTIGSSKILESMLKAVDSATDEECLTYETTTGDFEWQACGTGSGDSISVDGAAQVDPNFADSASVNFSAAANVITAAVNNDSHTHDAAVPTALSRFVIPTNYDGDSDGTVDASTWWGSTGKVCTYDTANNNSAIVWSPKYNVWIAIKNNVTANHGYIIKPDVDLAGDGTCDAVSTFDFPNYGGYNVDSEGVTITDPNGDYFYISTEQLGSTEYVMEYSIKDAIAGGNLTQTKIWTLPDAWCNNSNSWEAIAFVPDSRYGPTYWTRIPRGYFIGICQGVANSIYKFTLDTDSGGTAQTPTSVAGPLTDPCGLNYANGNDINYDWESGMLWAAAANELAWFDTALTCKGKVTVPSGTGDYEGMALGNGKLVLGDDAAGTWTVYDFPHTAFDPAWHAPTRQIVMRKTCDQTTEGEVCWDYDGDALTVGNGSTTTTIAVSGSSTDAWLTVSRFEDFLAAGDVDAVGSSNSCPLSGVSEDSDGTGAGAGGSANTSASGTMDSTTTGAGVIGGCYLSNNTTDGGGGSLGYFQTGKDMDQSVTAFTKLRTFRTRFISTSSNWSTATTRNTALVVGGFKTASISSNQVDYATITQGAFFICAPHLDWDDDGAADDGAEDNEWMFVVSNDTDGTFDACYTDGAGTCAPDDDITYYDTGVDCSGSGRNGVTYEFQIVYDGTDVDAYLDDNNDTGTWTWSQASISTDIPTTGYVALYGFMFANGTTPASVPITVDWVYYSGIR